MSTRIEAFEAEDPIQVDVGIAAGLVEVRLVDEPGVQVEVRHAPEAATPWMEGVSSLLSWVGGQLGDQSDAVDAPTEAVARTQVEFGAGRLTVRSSKSMPLRAIPLGVTVLARTGSEVVVVGGGASITVVGEAGRVKATSGSGVVDVERATGPVQVTNGTGAVRVGPVASGVRARSGSGDVEISAVAGPSSVTTGGGDVHLGRVEGDVMVRSGTGTITVADARSGQVELSTGTGGLTVAVAQGTPAEFDLTSGAGTVSNDLPLSREEPAAKPGLRVRGRTGSGDLTVTFARP
ncbi:DUF4097 family beta strand repeat-containing protein [Actinokineospora sp. G85]|uniref:DUF4097 family beta strand repeat-containing protein n=1 Tax=Actinokineospora sp. G85 TaxID=3406626 RepID=UPI003C720688